MKKILLGIILTLFLIGMIMPATLITANGPVPPESIPQKCKIKNDLGITNCPGRNIETGDEQEICCLIDAVHTVTNWIFYALFVIVIIMFVIGAGYIITSTGDAEKAKTGKTIITFAIVGLIVALLAKLAPAIVRYMVGL